DRAAEDHANQDPDRPGEKAELCRERGPNEWTGAGDRREVMAEHDPSVRRHVVATIVQALGWRHPIRIEREDLRRHPPTEEGVADQIAADRGGEQPGGADLLTAGEGEPGERPGANEGDEDPHEQPEWFGHARLLWDEGMNASKENLVPVAKLVNVGATGAAGPG